MRDLTSGYISQLTGKQIKPCFFVKIGFAPLVTEEVPAGIDQTLYAWSGLGKISWNGQTWTGLGWLGQISPINETTDVAAQNITLILSGIPPMLVSEAMSFCRQNAEVSVWFGFLDESNQVVAEPSHSFQGHLDVPTCTDGAQTCTIAITAENPLVDLNRASNRRFTDCDQQIRYPGDLGFSFVADLQNAVIRWPWDR